MERSRAAVAGALSGDAAVGLRATHSAWHGRGRASVRRVLAHADLRRESIDGHAGE